MNKTQTDLNASENISKIWNPKPTEKEMREQRDIEMSDFLEKFK